MSGCGGTISVSAADSDRGEALAVGPVDFDIPAQAADTENPFPAEGTVVNVVRISMGQSAMSAMERMAAATDLLPVIRIRSR